MATSRLNLLIALGLLLGLVTGLLAAATQSPLLLTIAEGSAPLGTLFINAVRMVVVPLVVAVVFVAVARMGSLRTLGRTGGQGLALYLLTLIPAVLIGAGVAALATTLVPDLRLPAADAPDIPELRGLGGFLLSLIPSNIFSAAAEGALLPLIVFTLLFAAAATSLPPERRERMASAAEDISDTLIQLVWWVLWLAPVGVFGLIAPATARLGWELLAGLAVFIGAVAVGLALLWLLVFAPLLRLRAKISPLAFLRGTAGAATVAFSTTSTATAIPVSLKEAERLGIREDARDLLIPLGASLYRPGSALFQAAAVVFLAHIFGVEIGLAGTATLLVATVLVSLTVAPVPSAGVITMAPALAALGIPASGLGLLLGIDRIPDMLRSTLNVWGQIAVAASAD